MRNKVILSVLLLVGAAGLLWAQFWKDYSDKERQTIAEAYWLAGKQYQAVGQTEKGGEYTAMAKLIYPQLDPAAIVDQALPSAAELLAQGKTTAIGAGAAGLPSGALNSFFLRFVSTLLDQDSAGVAAFLDGSVYLTKASQEMTRSDAQAALDALFKEVSLQGVEPSAVYDLNSIVLNAVPLSMQNAWGETYILKVTAKADYSKYLSFWDTQQQFYIRRVSGNWQIFAIGPSAPPLTWSPQKAAAVTAVAPAAAPEVEASTAITGAFNTFISDLLKKDADSALGFAGANVRFLRLRQTVTKDELKTSLLGYFDSTDFGSATFADVLDPNSIFVEPATSPVEGISGAVYALNAKAKVDLSAGIPFWSTYQKYYFAKDGANWVIFAIQ